LKYRVLIALGLLAIVVIYFVNARLVRGIPILAYHEIGPLGEGDSALFIEPDKFRRQIQYLEEQGYSSITLRQLHAHYTEGRELPPRAVVLTFDDGYRGIYEHAWPILREFGFVGVLFVTEYLDKAGYMTDSQVAALVAHGFELGNHSRTHTDLRTKTSAGLRAEVLDFKQELETRFDVSVVSFSYPMGYFDQQVVDAVKEGGHLIGVTTIQGHARAEQGLLTLHRVPIFRFDTMDSFARKLARGK